LRPRSASCRGRVNAPIGHDVQREEGIHVESGVLWLTSYPLIIAGTICTFTISYLHLSLSALMV
jgi:hypothetical protein